MELTPQQYTVKFRSLVQNEWKVSSNIQTGDKINLEYQSMINRQLIQTSNDSL